MPGDIEAVAIAAYKRQIKKLGVYSATAFGLPLAVGTLLFYLLGLDPYLSAYDAVLSLTLGGGSVSVDGIQKLVVIILSLCGVTFISLIVAIITTYVTKAAALEVDKALFQASFDESEKIEGQ